MILRLVLAAAVAVTVHFAQPASVEASCAWQSKSTPPYYIRVLRTRSGRVETVKFRRYVKVVMSYEWGGTTKPRELYRAAAVAVKQYAWKRSLSPRWYNGRCYHVKDSTADQIYAPGVKPITDAMRAAVRYTWPVTVWRDGSFILTQYTRGYDYPCAYDAGKRLYARSAKKCAKLGWSYIRILRTYYSASVR